MRHRSIQAITLIGFSLVLAACTAPGDLPGPASTTPSVTDTSATATTPSTATSKQASPRTWPTLSGLAGGRVELDGKELGRDGPESTKELLAALGEPDERHDSQTCGTQELSNDFYRWGDFTITVLQEVDKSNEYGETYPAGAIAGWRIDPVMDGLPGLAPNATGPQGTAIGTALDTLRERFTTEDWDHADVDETENDRAFSIFAGDTTGAVFQLDPNDQVVAMWAGYSC